MLKSIPKGTTKYADLDSTFCRPKTVCTTVAHFVARRQIVHGGDEMCRQRRYNLSPATNCAGATKCAVTRVFEVGGEGTQEAEVIQKSSRSSGC